MPAQLRPRSTLVMARALCSALLLTSCAGLYAGSDADEATEVPPTADPSDTRPAVTIVAVATMPSEAVVTAGGYVQDAVEEGGTCTFTVTQGDRSVSGSSEAEPDATTTWCANVDLTLPDPGQPWVLEFVYGSPTSAGNNTISSEDLL